MTRRLKYRKRPSQSVVAVQLALETSGFSYIKWGGRQRCKRGDWLVDSGGEVYTVDRVTFRRTYRQVGRGQYLKTTPVWAEVAAAAGKVRTKEGLTAYRAGDYVVFNHRNGRDGYAMSAAAFRRLYVRAQ